MIGLLLRLTWRGIRDIGLHPWAQFLTLLAVLLVTLFAGVFLLVMHNVDAELLRNKGQVQVQVYWQQDAPLETVREQWKLLKNLDGLRDIATFTPGQALDDLAKALGESGDFSWLEQRNPLAPTAFLAFALPPEDSQTGWAEKLLADLRNLPGVDRVHYNPMQMELARSWIALTKAVAWPFIGFMGLMVALLVGNTIKLSLLTRHDEIEILSLVGAKPWYIRWPLLTEGAVLGFLGSVLALAVLKIAHSVFADILNFPPLFVRLEYLPLPQAFGLIGAVTVVAVAASWVAGKD